MSASNISLQFPVTTEEYLLLDKEYGRLAYYQAEQLVSRNQNNNMTDDRDDVVQEIRIAMLSAGSYYKRQTYVESCLASLKDLIQDPVVAAIYKQLGKLWEDRRRHGAGRQKFGGHQEALLEQLVNHYVPAAKRPSRNRPLSISSDFATYFKQITWNRQKHLGKKITRDKSWRTGLVSLSEFDYLQ